MTPVIRIDDQVMDELKGRAVEFGLIFEPPNATLRRILKLDMDVSGHEVTEEVKINAAGIETAESERVIDICVTGSQQLRNKHPVVPMSRIGFFPPPGVTFELELPSGKTISAMMGKGKTVHRHMHSEPEGEIQRWWRQTQVKEGNILRFEEVAPKAKYKITVILTGAEK